MTAPAPPSRRRLPEEALAALAALALAAVLLYPALPDPRARALGHPLVDTYNHVWGFWQVGQAAAALESPLHTTLLRWPEGGSIWFIDLFGAITTLPVQAILGPVAAYNVSMGLQLALAGFAAWGLARHVTGSAGAAIAAGRTRTRTTTTTGRSRAAGGAPPGIATPAPAR